MKSSFVFLFFFLCAVHSPANDSEFFGSGSNLAPVRSSKISLKKEVLTFTIDSNFAHVNVDFDFYNPGKDTVITVGFVAPKGGDWGHYSEPEIHNFTVNLNGRNLLFKKQDLKATTFSSLKKEFNEPTVVYYFEAPFRTGINKVLHSFDFKAGSSVVGNFFNYILQTGSLWANRKIDDFTLIVKNNTSDIIYLPEDLISKKKSKWKIVGEGKFGGLGDEEYMGGKNREVFIKSGYAEFKAKAFKPKRSLLIWSRPIAFYTGKFPENEMHTYDMDVNPKLTKEELKILRNSFYALHGYGFKDQMLRSYFEKFCWYFPDETKTLEEIHASLTQEQRNKIEAIKAREKEL